LKLHAKPAVRISAVLILLLIVLISSWWHSLPQPLFSTPYSSILLDRNNQLLEARIASDEQWRFPPSKTLPKPYISALLLFEDKRFYEHIGIDGLALARATHITKPKSRKGRKWGQHHQHASYTTCA